MTALRLQDIAVGYRHTPIPGLSGLNVSVQPGEIVLVVGLNGSGKSSLLRTIVGVQPPVQGIVWLNDVALDKMPVREKAMQVGGMLTGSVRPASMRVFDYIATGRYPHVGFWGKDPGCTEKVHQAAQLARCEHLLNKQVTETSDGEFQRIAVARLMAQEADVWVLDEPAAFLDISGRFALHQLLLQAAMEWGKSVIISSHDLELSAHERVTCWLLAPKGLEVIQGGPSTRERLLDYFCQSDAV
jgi:iron complex transport system ATP-binding protein